MRFLLGFVVLACYRQLKGPEVFKAEPDKQRQVRAVGTV